MSLRVRLLGPPALIRDDTTAPLEGRKTWALLAYLLLESRPPTRRELAERLWSDAADPFGALRWALSQVRKAISPSAEIVERDDRLSCEPRDSFTVDAHELLDGSWEPDEVEDLARGALLEGIDLDESPDFARWLEVQRARIASASASALRTAASVVVRSDPRRAIAIAERGLLFEPFDDGFHALIVEGHVAAGDLTRARAYADEVASRYREELGVAVPDAITRALERPSRPTAPATATPAQIRTLLQTAHSRMRGGDMRGAHEIAMRAATGARSAGDDRLEAGALAEAVNYATLAMEGTPSEWRGLLHRAAALARGDALLVCDIERELGRINAIEARYGAAEASQRRSLALARELGQTHRIALAELFLGIVETDRCDFEAAEAHLRAAVKGHRDPHVPLAWLARLLVRSGRYDEAVETATRSLAIAAERASVMQVALAHLQIAEAALASEDDAKASEHLGLAHTVATETRDPEWTALALRGLALIDERAGRPERARATMREALAAARSRAGSYRWVEVRIIVDLAAWDAASSEQLSRAVALARSAPMPDLLERLTRDSHTLSHTAAV